MIIWIFFLWLINATSPTNNPCNGRPSYVPGIKGPTVFGINQHNVIMSCLEIVSFLFLTCPLTFPLGCYSGFLYCKYLMEWFLWLLNPVFVSFSTWHSAPQNGLGEHLLFLRARGMIHDPFLDGLKELITSYSLSLLCWVFVFPLELVLLIQILLWNHLFHVS